MNAPLRDFYYNHQGGSSDHLLLTIHTFNIFPKPLNMKNDLIQKLPTELVLYILEWVPISSARSFRLASKFCAALASPRTLSTIVLRRSNMEDFSKVFTLRNPHNATVHRVKIDYSKTSASVDNPEHQLFFAQWWNLVLCDH